MNSTTTTTTFFVIIIKCKINERIDCFFDIPLLIYIFFLSIWCKFKQLFVYEWDFLIDLNFKFYALKRSQYPNWSDLIASYCIWFNSPPRNCDGFKMLKIMHGRVFTRLMLSVCIRGVKETILCLNARFNID